MKKKKLIDLITKVGIFGKSDGHVAVIEFQKRGVPHCHILIWIKGFVVTPANIDSVICAELPPRNDPLHQKFLKLMMHGPCGPFYNQRLGCVKDSKDGCCMRGFPKPFNSRTSLGKGTFPEYRRRSPEEGGNTGKKWVQPLRMDVEIDNR